MKRFYTRRGFTIVEVLVAFVIFAIMAGMVSMILNITMQTKQKNNDLEEEIDGQEQAYYLATQDKTYSGSDGKLTFNMGSSSLDIDYQVGDPNSSTDDNELALEYFIGNVNYDATKNTTTNVNNEDSEETAGSVTARLDTRIYGSTGIKQIIAQMKPVNNWDGTNYNGTGYVYCLQSMASQTAFENSVTDGQDTKYNERFGDEDESSLDSGMVQVKWAAQYRLVFPSEILDYGYTNKIETDFATADTSGLTMTPWTSSTSETYEVYSPASKTLRISSKLKGFSAGPRIFNGGNISYYVVLKEKITDSNLNADGTVNMNKVFGNVDNDPTTAKKGSKNADGSYVFVCYKEYDKDAENNIITTSSTKHPNVFAAFEKTSTE